MENFISTQTAILLSFLLKNMPNLFRHIVECSTEFNINNPLPADLPITILSSKQIQEARAHSNNIAFNLLNAVAMVQNALSSTNGKIEKLSEQRNKIENILVKLISIDEKNTQEKEE